MKRFLSWMLAVVMLCAMLPLQAWAIGAEDGPGIKSAELIDRRTNRYTVTIDVPGVENTSHDEVILMVDGSYSLDEEWPAMKEAINTIGRTVLNGSGSTRLTLMAFGMGENIVLKHISSAGELAAALGELPGTLLYGRSSTNCEAGFNGVARYISSHDSSLKDAHVIYISDGNVNTDETPRAFGANWKTWATKFGPLTVAQTAFEGALFDGENLPDAFYTVFGDRFADAQSSEEIADRAFGGEVTNEEFIAFADQVWADVYAYSGMELDKEYPVSVAERAFVKYDKEKGTYIQDVFYYTTYKSEYVTYGNRVARTKTAANALAAMDKVASMYVVDYDGYTAWMDTGITSSKSTFVHANGIAGLATALSDALNKLAKTPYNDVVVTDYMSKWVNLDTDSLRIIDNKSGEVLWSAKQGWLTEDRPTAAEVPVTAVKVDPADYEAGGSDVLGNTHGDIYKLTWYVKDGPLTRNENYRLAYEVVSDVEESGFVYDTSYPANGKTEAEYKDESGEDKRNEIAVPVVDAQPVKVDLTIKKVDEYGGLLTGAEFTLDADLDGDGSNEVYVVDENGTAILKDLTEGSYVLTETKVPEGYMAAAEGIAFTVSKSGQITVHAAAEEAYMTDRALNIVNIEVDRHTVRKVWEDNDNNGGTRPSSIVVRLRQDGQNYGRPIVLNRANGWTYTWENLPKDHTYTAYEVSVPANYRESTVTSGENTVITNTLTVRRPQEPTPTVRIPEENPPMANRPPVVNTVELDEADTMTILDEEVPLAQAPKTGDVSSILMATGSLAGASLLICGKGKKKEENEDTQA